MNTQNAESTVKKKGLKTVIKGIILIERPHHSISAMLPALAGMFLAARGNIPELNFWLVVKICFLFWCVHCTAHPINDYFDREADKTGRPKAPIPAGLLTLKQVRVIIIMNYIIAIILIPILSPNYFIILFALLHLLSGFIYSAPPIQMCSRSVGGPITIAVGAAMMPFLGGWSAIASGKYELMLLLFCGGYLFFMIALRVPQDVADMTGDKRSGRATIPLQIGITRAYYVSLSTAFIGGSLFFLAFFVAELNIYYLAVWGLSILCFTSPLLKFKKELQEEFARKVFGRMILSMALYSIAIIAGSI